MVGKKLIELFQSNGYMFITEHMDEEILMDSIEYVSLIVEIETEFDIEIPDKYLGVEKLQRFSDYHDMVTTLLGETVV